MAEEVENRLLALALRDLDVDQCIEEWFGTFTPLSVTTSPPRLMQMVLPRPSLPAQPRLLPRELREELLELCAELVPLAKAQKLQTLLICGVEPGVGASFVATHLSRILAEISRLRIAILTVGRAEEPGQRMARNLAMRRAFDYLLFRTERPNLMEIASAQGPITLPELLGGAAATAALQQLQQEFDFIVIDAPAVAWYAEVALLAARADGVVLVAEQNVTSLRQMDCAHQRLGRAQANVLGVVLNRQPVRRSRNTDHRQP